MRGDRIISPFLNPLSGTFTFVVGTQINMMQEQEIVRLEMRLKDEEVQRYDVSRQLDQLRKAILEKDQLRMKQQGEMFHFKERISQLDESNAYFKNTADEGQQKIWDMEESNRNLSDEILSLRSQLNEAKSEVSKLCLDVKHSEMRMSEMDEEIENTKKALVETQVNLETQVTR